MRNFIEFLMWKNLSKVVQVATGIFSSRKTLLVVFVGISFVLATENTHELQPHFKKNHGAPQAATATTRRAA